MQVINKNFFGIFKVFRAGVTGTLRLQSVLILRFKGIWQRDAASWPESTSASSNSVSVMLPMSSKSWSVGEELPKIEEAMLGCDEDTAREPVAALC